MNGFQKYWALWKLAIAQFQGNPTLSAQQQSTAAQNSALAANARMLTRLFIRMQNNLPAACSQREQAGPLSAAERAEALRLAKDFSKVWKIANAIERKRIVRLVIRDVTLDQSRDSALVSIRITWQTGATSRTTFNGAFNRARSAYRRLYWSVASGRWRRPEKSWELWRQ